MGIVREGMVSTKQEKLPNFKDSFFFKEKQNKTIHSFKICFTFRIFNTDPRMNFYQTIFFFFIIWLIFLNKISNKMLFFQYI